MPCRSGMENYSSGYSGPSAKEIADLLAKSQCEDNETVEELNTVTGILCSVFNELKRTKGKIEFEAFLKKITKLSSYDAEKWFESHDADDEAKMIADIESRYSITEIEKLKDLIKNNKI